MPAAGGGAREHFPQRCDLDRIADGSGRAVRFYILNIRGFEAGSQQSGANRACLPRCARGGISGLRTTVIVDCGSTDYGVNRVAIRNRLRQALEQHHSRSARAHRALRTTVERSAMTVGRKDAAVLCAIPAMTESTDGRTTGQGHRTLVAQDRLASQMNRNERRGAGRVQRYARASEIQQVRDACRRARVGGKQSHTRGGFELVEGRELLQQIGAEPRTDENADLLGAAPVAAAGILQRLLRTLHEQALLGAADRGFARREPEVSRIKQMDALNHCAALDVAGMSKLGGTHAGSKNFVVLERCDRLDAVAQIGPERIDIRSPRKSTGQPDHGDGLQVTRHLRSLNHTLREVGRETGGERAHGPVSEELCDAGLFIGPVGKKHRVDSFRQLLDQQRVCPEREEIIIRPDRLGRDREQVGQESSQE